MTENIIQHSKIFKALADPTRLEILRLLSAGELCACVILEKFSISQPTLSYHMKTLTSCKLVKERKQGKWTYYTLELKTFKDISCLFTDLTKRSDFNYKE